MIIDLNAFEGRSKNVELEIAPEGINLEADNARLVGPVHLQCEISRNGFQTAIAGKIEARYEVDCSRCLEPVNVSLPLDFQIEFVDSEHFGSEGEHEIDPKNLSADSLATDHLDLHDVVREQLLLNLPERLVCREDCKGLCEVCGTNRNAKDCNCNSEEVDPRWSALKNLK